MKRRILIFTGYYAPAVKAGGPVQSVKNLIERLSDHYMFYVVTSDRDLGDTMPFPHIETESWKQDGAASIYYIDPKKLTWRKVRELLDEVEHDVLYLNSFFSYQHSIVPLLLTRTSSVPTILAPRGQFSSGALGLKSRKKQLFIHLARTLRLYDGVMWHATSPIEEMDITRVFRAARTSVATNLARRQELYAKPPLKEPGQLKLLYVSRIHPMKNLEQLLRLLPRVTGRVELSLYGPTEDAAYFSRCQKWIDDLPADITVTYHGLLPADEVSEAHKQHHAFVLLSKGENFGHAIAEALGFGRPVLISDRTPWLRLDEAGVGFDVPLEDDDGIVRRLQQLVDLNDQDYQMMSRLAYAYAERRSGQNEVLAHYQALFN